MTQQEAMAETAKRKPAGDGVMSTTCCFPLEGRYTVSCGHFHRNGVSWAVAVADAIQREKG